MLSSFPPAEITSDAVFCRETVEREMREAFVEMFGPEIADGVVEVKICANWGEK